MNGIPRKVVAMGLYRHERSRYNRHESRRNVIATLIYLDQLLKEAHVVVRTLAAA